MLGVGLQICVAETALFLTEPKLVFSKCINTEIPCVGKETPTIY